MGIGSNTGAGFKIKTDIYNWVIISLGGPMIISDAINTTFISEFNKVIVGQTEPKPTSKPTYDVGFGVCVFKKR